MELTGWIDEQKRALLRAISTGLTNPMELIKPSPEAFANEPMQRNIMAGIDPDTRQPVPETFAQHFARVASPQAVLGSEPANIALGFLGNIKAKGNYNVFDQAYHDYIYKNEQDPVTAFESVKKEYSGWTGVGDWYPGVSSGLPKIEPPSTASSWDELKKLSAELQGKPARTSDAESAAIKAMEEQHGIPPEDVYRIQNYTKNETAQDILARFDQARQNGVDLLGLPANNTHVDRAIAMGYSDPGNIGNYLWRGSYTQRPELQTPVQQGLPFEKGRDIYTFASLPGSQGYKGFGNKYTPYVTNIDPRSQYFDTRNPEHMDVLLNELVNSGHFEGEGGKLGEWDWKALNSNWNKENRDWGALEMKPITEAIRRANFPGILTEEQGTNIGTFHPESLRHPVAAFDPMYMFSPNNFASWAPVGAITGLAAALAGQEPAAQP